MKNIFLSLVILSFAVNTYAQKQNFDIASFISPKGWKQQSTGSALQLSKEDTAKGIYTLITLYKAIPGAPRSKANFDTAWEAIVKSSLTVSNAPEMQPVINKGDWEVQSGYAPFESDNAKGVALLLVSTGFSQATSILIITNTDAYEPEMTKFLESIEFKAPEQTPAPTASSSMLTKHIWKQSQNRKDGSGSFAGYSTNTYEFYNNGTYKFSTVTFQYYTPKYYMIDETGTYKVNGNSVTLHPTKSYFHTHAKAKTDPVLKSGSFSLAVVEYRFEFTTIYDRFRLVLAPVNGVETKRDGGFNYYANGQMTKSYLYDAGN